MGYVRSRLTRVCVGNEEGDNVTWEDNLSHYQKMIFYAVSHEFGVYSEPSEEIPNSDDVRFYNLLGAVNMPL